MSWLFFLDESGHDHRNLPYEVRGGVAIHAGSLWSFVQSVQRLELDAFGTRLSLYKKELKGSSLLDRKRYRFASQGPEMPDEARRKHCRAFLQRGLEKASPSRDEFTAYGQACLRMASGIFQSLRDHNAVVIAAAIPKDVVKPNNEQAEEYLRKDHVFLFERFFYLLETKKDHGMLVMDEADKTEDRRFVRRLEAYFTKTQTGRYRTRWIVPSPFFVSSDMAYPIQAADLCIYCVNWGFRVPSVGMNAAMREEISNDFGPWLGQMQFRGDAYKDGFTYPSFGIVYVPDPYTPR
ncbi:MAG: DUF3800 domain-containing protein [Pirellulaceae bacterium]